MSTSAENTSQTCPGPTVPEPSESVCSQTHTVNGGQFKTKHELSGLVFGKLTAVAPAGNGDWICLCSCGEKKRRSAFSLIKGKAISCGCAALEIAEGRRARFLDLTQSTLKEILHYDQDSGVFTWLESIALRIKVGSVAGSKSPNGYVYIKIGPRRYAAHHLAWLYVHGAMPEDQIDHRNLIRDDNRISNLRESDAFLNRQNTKLQRNNTSGFKGVSGCRNGRWSAEIMVNRKTIRLGSFPTPAEASEAYLAAKRKLHSFYIEGQGVKR